MATGPAAPPPVQRLARFEGFELDLRTGELRAEGGDVVSLGEKPLRILKALVARPRELVSRDELQELLWPNGTIVEFEHSINAAVNRLRQVLGDSAERPRYIETLARRGYRWLVSVEYEAIGPAAATAARGAGALIGSKVGHYRILEVIGGGGMGVVFRAQDLRLGRSVALKFLGEEFLGDTRATERFEREARTISALDHPNICTLYGVEEHEGHPVIVMQWLQGETLSERIAAARTPEGAFTAEELVRTAVAILDALNAAHEKGIIHRDVKPANVFVTRRDEVKLLDFGLATLANSRAELDDGEHAADTPSAALALTETGATIGTASYMAPEQILGESVDGRTDLFSLGVVLYEMATGRRPFQGSSHANLRHAILNSTPEPAAGLNPALPPRLGTIIERALAKAPAQRYQSAQEMRAELLRVPRTTPGLAAAPRVPTAWLRVAAALTGGALTVALVALLHNLFATRAAAERPLLAKLTDSGRVENVAISRDGRYVAYTQHEPEGVSVRVRTVGSHDDTLLSAAAEGTRYLGLSFSPGGDAVYAVRADDQDPGFRSLYRLARTGGAPRLVARDVDSPASFSPDGHTFAYTRGVPVSSVVELHVASADASDDRMVATIPGVFAGFQPGATWSPDGHTITLPLRRFGNVPRYVLYAVSATSGQVSELWQSATPIGRSLWLPDGSGLVAPLEDRQGRRQLWLMPYPRGERRQLSNDLTNYDTRPDLAADGSTLAAISGTWVGNIWSLGRAPGSQPQQLTALSLPLESVAEGPDGRLIASSAAALFSFSPDGRQYIALDDSGDVQTVTVCGRYLVTRMLRGNGTNIVRFNADWTHPLKLASGDFWLPECARSGRHVFFVDYSAPGRLWRVGIEGGAPSQVGRLLGDDVVGRLNISDDESRIIYPYEQFAPQPAVRLGVVPVEGNLPSRVIDLPGGVYAFGAPLLSPDGKQLDYIITRGGASNIFALPLDGGTPRQLTHFETGRILDFSWSRDGTRLLMCRGELTRDVVLLTNINVRP